MGLGLSSLEVELERSKRISNFEFDLLKRFFERQPISERYTQHRLNIHVHGSLNGVLFCAECRAVRDGDDVIVRDGNQFVVLVEVTESGEVFRPLASIVRLQRLDSCDVGLVDTPQEGLFPSVESVWRAFDRKLGFRLSAAGIKFGELPYEVIQGGTETVGGVPNEKAAFIGDWCSAGNNAHDFSALTWWNDFGLKIYSCGLCLCLTNGVAERIQLREVFGCPVDTQIGIG